MKRMQGTNRHRYLTQSPHRDTTQITPHAVERETLAGHLGMVAWCPEADAEWGECATMRTPRFRRGAAAYNTLAWWIALSPLWVGFILAGISALAKAWLHRHDPSIIIDGIVLGTGFVVAYAALWRYDKYLHHSAVDEATSWLGMRGLAPTSLRERDARLTYSMTYVIAWLLSTVASVLVF